LTLDREREREMSDSYVFVEFYGVLYLCDVIVFKDVVVEREKYMFSVSFNGSICRISKILGLD